MIKRLEIINLRLKNRKLEPKVQQLNKPKIKYFVKLVNGDKYEISKAQHEEIINKVGRDYITIDTPQMNNVWILKERILLTYSLKVKK